MWFTVWRDNRDGVNHAGICFTSSSCRSHYELNHPASLFPFHAVGRVITDQHAIFIRGRIIILPSSIALCPFVLDWLRDKLPGGCSGPWLPTAATCQRQGKRKRTLGREEIADTLASKDAMHFSYRFPNWGTCVRNTQPFTCCRCYCCRSDLQGFEIQSLFFHKQMRPWFTSLWSAQVKQNEKFVEMSCFGVKTLHVQGNGNSFQLTI